jgi:hypothetical protein
MAHPVIDMVHVINAYIESINLICLYTKFPKMAMSCYKDTQKGPSLRIFQVVVSLHYIYLHWNEIVREYNDTLLL